MSIKQTIIKQLEALVFQETIPFCCLCHIKAPTGQCDNCGSDDLLRLHEETGCQYGVDWFIEDILKENLEPVNEKQVFEQMVADCYPIETKVGWLELNTADTLKVMCSGGWEQAQDESIYSLEEDEEILSFDDGKIYFWTSDIEELLEKKLNERTAI